MRGPRFFRAEKAGKEGCILGTPGDSVGSLPKEILPGRIAHIDDDT